MKLSALLAAVRRRKKTSHIIAQQGFSLLEIIIVLAIIGTLMGVVISQLGSSNKQAKVKETAIKAGTISSALMRYQVDMGKFPTTTEGLSVLSKNPGNPRWTGPYVNGEEDLNDAWGNAFEYELSSKGPVVISHGADGANNGGNDLRYINGKLEEKASSEGSSN